MNSVEPTYTEKDDVHQEFATRCKVFTVPTPCDDGT